MLIFSMAQPPLRPQDAVMLIPSLEPDDRLPAYVRRLLDYVQTRGCEIAGDYICEVVVDFPMLDFDRRRMFYKAQIPVRFFG